MGRLIGSPVGEENLKIRSLIWTFTALFSVLLAPNARAERLIHIEQVTVRCETDQNQKFDVKPSASYIKKCEGKNKCSTLWYFKDAKMICPADKKQLVATIRCGADQKSLTSFGRHTLLCTERRFTIDGK